MNKKIAGSWLKGAVALLALSGLGAPVSALSMMVWDQGMETKLAYGELEGGVMRGRVISDATGRVVVLFSRSDVERGRAQYSGLRARYEGELRGGQVMIRVPSGLQSLEQFLAAYKLKVELTEIPGGR
ncbi:hypothetical protein GCM10017783_04340 [Deinococcus piscis]|uniref:Uncharacterized protein n=1 Tax=Deinococcus piscis TaxID=394230 RepID=A0ABQ3K1H5_9DEIO|nr:hypothetical protein [Deinococcus piscis]GHF95571.1 hypothetical protein GCM10017783_04340 [Deinococcus piscis]